MRMTVKVRMPHDTTERDFHVNKDVAAEFADRVRRQGGEARIVPLTLSPVLKTLLRTCGVDDASIH